MEKQLECRVANVCVLDESYDCLSSQQRTMIEPELLSRGVVKMRTYRVGSQQVSSLERRFLGIKVCFVGSARGLVCVFDLPQPCEAYAVDLSFEAVVELVARGWLEGPEVVRQRKGLDLDDGTCELKFVAVL
eukprot:Amastigsp_a3848_6.p2 type:complete len:132 gc:universal Amastigsp_a3848_6:426-31(-)